MKDLRLLTAWIALAALTLACAGSALTATPAADVVTVVATLEPAGVTSTPEVSIPSTGGGGAIDVAALVSAALTQLEQGRLAFNPPSEMTVGQTERVTVRIAKEAGADNIGVGMAGVGEATVEPIKVGTFMKARLQGQGFDIQPLNNEEQIVAGDTFTEWQWDVTPREAGPHKLSLLVTVRINVPDMGEEQRDFPVKDAVVNVRVTPGVATQRFMQDNWTWLLLVLVAGIGSALFFAVRSRRHANAFDATADLPASLAGLHELLYTHFDDDELQTLGLKIGARPDIIGGDNAITRARNLTLFAYQRGKLPALVAACKAQRPNVAWPVV